MSNRKTINEKIEAAKLEKEQMEARIKKLLQEQKAEERKARSHRFCKRGGFMEKLLPDLALITDEQFETFFKNTTANNYGRKALAELVPPTPETTIAAEGGETTQEDKGDAAKTPVTPQNNNTNGNHKPAQAGTQHGGNANGKTAEAARVAG